MWKETSTIIVIAMLLTMGGACQTSSRDRVADTQTVLKDLRAELIEGKVNIDRAMAVLKALTLHKGDLTEPYEIFVDQVEATQTQGESMNGRLEEMQANGQIYFEGWATDAAKITNPEVKRRSLARRAELKAMYSEIEGSMVETKRAYEPFISDLRDIQKFLEADLSSGGIAAISDSIKMTEEKSRAVKEGINKIIETLERAERSMSSTRR